MQRVAIIIARSGSKGLKDKNIIDLCGQPLMAYTIQAAIGSDAFCRVIVSTDSDKYAGIARQYGAEVMMRSAELASDNATSFMVIEDVLSRLKQKIDYFVLLQPTSPLRTANHILEAVKKFDSQIDAFDFLVSMKKAEFTKDLVNIIEEDESLKHFDKDFSNYRRQSYSYYSPNGAIFIGKSDAYLRQKHFFGPKSLAYIMSEEDSVDIDHKIDLELATIIMEERNGK